MRPLSALLFFFLAAAGQARAQSVTLARVAGGLSDPVCLVVQSGLFFVCEQRGVIRIIENGVIVPQPFLDISGRVLSGGERGLLSLAFHPQFAANGRFFVTYSTHDGREVIEEYRASGRAADPASAKTLLAIRHPLSNHLGGQLAFGPDGFLYAGFGDGGGAGDSDNNAQNLRRLDGKILRIDVNRGARYAVPRSNPFFRNRRARREIYALGFRNPWRFSFDVPTGRLFVADVGQNQREEIDLVVRGGNYGWRRMEGSLCFNPGRGCRRRGLRLPIGEYGRNEGITVIGGFVYRGARIAQLQGKYVFGDFGSGTLFTLTEQGRGRWLRQVLLSSNLSISTFGIDQSGELYLFDYASGDLYRIDPT